MWIHADLDPQPCFRRINSSEVLIVKYWLVGPWFRGVELRGEGGWSRVRYWWVAAAPVHGCRVGVGPVYAPITSLLLLLRVFFGCYGCLSTVVAVHHQRSVRQWLLAPISTVGQPLCWSLILGPGEGGSAVAVVRPLRVSLPAIYLSTIETLPVPLEKKVFLL